MILLAEKKWTCLAQVPEVDKRHRCVIVRLAQMVVPLGLRWADRPAASRLKTSRNRSDRYSDGRIRRQTTTPELETAGFAL